MRLLTLLLLVLLLCSVLVAQQKYLVSPNQEVIPLLKGERAADVIAKRLNLRDPFDVNAHTCTNKFTFGYTTDLFRFNTNFGAYH